MRPVAAGRPPGKAPKPVAHTLELMVPKLSLPGKKRGRKPGVKYPKKLLPALEYDDDDEDGGPRKSHRACVAAATRVSLWRAAIG